MTARYVETRECFYSTDWRSLDFCRTNPLINSPMQRPKNLEKMLEIASILSSDFYFARIDLYHEHGQIYFGEITHHPAGGLGKFDPPEWDRKLGDMLILPLK